jgi:hypothetical protein
LGKGTRGKVGFPIAKEDYREIKDSFSDARDRYF